MEDVEEPAQPTAAVDESEQTSKTSEQVSEQERTKLKEESESEQDVGTTSTPEKIGRRLTEGHEKAEGQEDSSINRESKPDSTLKEDRGQETPEKPSSSEGVEQASKERRESNRRCGGRKSGYGRARNKSKERTSKNWNGR